MVTRLVVEELFFNFRWEKSVYYIPLYSISVYYERIRDQSNYNVPVGS